MTTTSRPAPQQWFHGATPPPAPGPDSGLPAWAVGAQPPAPRRRMWPWVTAGVGALVLVLAAVVGTLLMPSTLTLRGQVDGYSSEYLSVFAGNGFYPTGAAGECTGNGGFGDVRQGAVVSVYDTAGTLVGTGQLQAGTGVEGHCTFAFEISEVPAADLYQVEVAQRGKLPYTADEVEQGIRMDIGS